MQHRPFSSTVVCSARYSGGSISVGRNSVGLGGDMHSAFWDSSISCQFYSLIFLCFCYNKMKTDPKHW